MTREARENPSKFVSGEAGDLFAGMFVIPIISALTLLGGLFILGFTHFLGGPYGFFRFFFYIAMFCVFCFFYLLRKVYKTIKNTTKSMLDNTIKVDSKVVE